MCVSPLTMRPISGWREEKKEGREGGRKGRWEEKRGRNEFD